MTGVQTCALPIYDEYPTDDLLPFIPYHRESRRIHGLVRFNLNDLTHPYEQEDKLYRTTIAVGDYPVDHHHTRYHGYEELPDLYFYPIPSYGLPLGTLIPHEVDNLIVAEKSISVSNIVNGTTRLQPVVIQIGQAAGALAALSFLHQKNIKDVSTRDVQNAILESGGYLFPFLDVEVGNIIFKPLQRIGATGILKGKGKNVDWSNETWLYADSLVHISELEGLLDYYPTLKNKFNIKDDNTITIAKTIEWIDFIISNQNSSRKMNTQYSIEEIWEKHGFDNLNLNRNIKRGEFAVLIDQILDPFNNYHIDIKGELIN